MDQVTGGDTRLRLELILTFFVFLAVIGLLRIGTYQTPPTWDAAMTVWPAAIEMSQSGLVAVLQMPTYEAGGPNTHTLSLVTLVTAATIGLLGSTAAIVLGHIANTVILAIIGVVVFALVRPHYSRLGAGLVGLATITFPVMIGQSAYLYTELPASLFVLLALVATTHRRPLLGGVMAALGTAIKPLAVVVVPVVWLLARRRGYPPSRYWAAAGIGLVGLIPSMLVPAGSLGGTAVDRIQNTMWTSSIFLRHAPELVVVGSAAFGLWLIARRKVEDSVWASTAAALVGFFVAFFLTNGLLTPGYFALPRYFVLIVPAVFVSAALVMSDQKRLVLVLMGFVTVFSLVTFRGPFALGNHTNIQPLAERSLAFVELFRMHRVALEQLADLSKTMPVYYNHHSHYAVEYPGLNHLVDRIDNGASASFQKVWDGTLESLPRRFAMIMEFPWLGGEVLRDIYEAAIEDPGYSVETIEIAGQVEGGVELAIISKLDQ